LLQGRWVEPQNVAKLIEQGASCFQLFGYPQEGRFRDNGVKGPTKTSKYAANGKIEVSSAKEIVNGTPDYTGAMIEIEVRSIEGEAEVIAIGRIVQDPLNKGPHDRKSRTPCRQRARVLEEHILHFVTQFWEPSTKGTA
jgi:hypothetical protein